MTDELIANMLTYYTRTKGIVAETAANDIRALAAEIDAQRQTATQLAAQSQRLRAESEGRRVVLERIREYAQTAAGNDEREWFAIGTIKNMVTQLWDVEKE